MVWITKYMERCPISLGPCFSVIAALLLQPLLWIYLHIKLKINLWLEKVCRRLRWNNLEA